MVDRWPALAADLAAALAAANEDALAAQVGSLTVRSSCGCGDDFCQSFYTDSRDWEGRMPRTIDLESPGAGMLIVDVVDGEIAFVEVLFREQLN